MIGDNIRAARKKASLTQEELAQRIGVKRSVISKYENGTIDPTFSQIQRIADTVNVHITELVDFREFSDSLNAAIPLLDNLKNIKHQTHIKETVVLSDDDRASIRELAELFGKIPTEILDSNTLSDSLKIEYDELFSTLNLHGKALAVKLMETLASDPSLKVK